MGSFSPMVPTRIPAPACEHLRAVANGSIIRAKSVGDSGQPCCVSLSTAKKVDRAPQFDLGCGRPVQNLYPPFRVPPQIP